MTHALAPTLLADLQRIPDDRPVAFLVRHSVRGPLPPDLSGQELPITPAGVALARELGSHLKHRIGRTLTSPLVRCVQTAEHLLVGAEVSAPVEVAPPLGHVRTFMTDEALGYRSLKSEGLGAVLRGLFREQPLPGYAHRREGGERLLRWMLSVPWEAPITVLSSHDLFVTSLVTAFSGTVARRKEWPRFLEGALLWWEGDRLVLLFRGERFERPPPEPEEAG